MRLVALLAALVLGLWPSLPARATILLTGAGCGKAVCGANYVGPGDIATFTAWYSCARAYNAAFADGNHIACNLRNTATTETCDLALSTAGTPEAVQNCSIASNGVSLATFCTTPCTVTKMYDQTGGGRDILQATAANQPGLTVSCLGGLPCFSFTSASITLASAATFTPASGVLSLSAVGERTAGTGTANFIQENALSTNGIRATTSTAWKLGSLSFTATEAAWHAMNGAINGASSAINSDGTVTSGTTTGNTTAGAITVIGAASTTIVETELGFKDATAFSAGTATSLCQNAQTAYGGGGNFAATC